MVQVRTGGGLPRALTIILGLAALVVALLGAAQFADLVAPVFLALNLAIVMWPLQAWLSRRTNRLIGALGSGLASLGILVLFFWGIGWALSAFVQEMPHYKPQFEKLWDQAIALLGTFGITSTQITDQLKTVNPGSVVSVVGSVASNVGSVLSILVIVVTVLLFLTIDSMGFEERLTRLAERHNRVLVLALQSFAQGVRRYWVTCTVFGLAVAVLTYLGLLWIGVPLALVWAVLSFVTNYIPNVGFVIGLVPAALMGFLEKGLLGLVWVIVLYGALNFVIQSVLQPKMTGDAVGVTATVSFLSLLLWAVVLGPLGALLALPATLLVKALVVDADPKARWINALISSNPKTSEEEAVIPEASGRVFRPIRRRPHRAAAGQVVPGPAPAPAEGQVAAALTDDPADREVGLPRPSQQDGNVVAPADGTAMDTTGERAADELVEALAEQEDDQAPACAAASAVTVRVVQPDRSAEPIPPVEPVVGGVAPDLPAEDVTARRRKRRRRPSS